MKKILAFIVLILIFVINGYSQITISKIAGNAQVLLLSQNVNNYQTAQNGITLGKNDKIRTGNNSSIQLKVNAYDLIIFKDSVILIEDIDNTSNKVVIRVIYGSLRLINNALVEQANIVIRSGNAEVKPKGTDFVVEYTTANQTSLYVFQGKAQAANLNNAQQPITIEAYQMSQIIGNNSPQQAGIIPADILIKYGVSSKPELIQPKITPMPSVAIKTQQPPKPIAPTNAAPANLAPTNKAPINLAPTNKAPIAQTNKPKEPEEKSEPWCPNPKLEFHLSFDINYISFNNIGYASLAFMPEFSYCKIGMGFYLPIYYNYRYNFLNPSKSWYNYDEWDFKSPKDSWHDLWVKFLYIRYGEEGDPLYIRIGGLQSVTLGNGFIMFDYSNMANFPQIRKLGLEFDYTYKKTTGIETIVGDLNNAALYGGRYIIYPFFFNQEMGILNKLQLGATLVYDRLDQDEKVINWGVDSQLPLIKTESTKLIYGIDLAKYSIYAPDDLGKQGWISSPNFGFSTGFRGNLSILLYRAEYRFLQQGYIPEYFDAFYDIERDSRFLELLGMYEHQPQPNLNGYLVSAGVSLAGVSEAGFIYEEYYGMNTPIVNDAKLYLTLKRGVIPKIYGTGTYTKRDIVGLTGDRSLFGNLYDPNTLLTFDGGYAIFPFTYLTIYFQRSFFYNSQGQLQSFDTWSFGMSMGF